MRHLTYIIFVAFVLSTLGVSSSLGHDVGEPELEKLQIWKQCCAGQDCVPQNVKIFRKGEEKVAVEIEGTQIKVDKEKLSPVPSPHAWVCYVDPARGIANENIRCILFPEKPSTVRAPDTFDRKVELKPVPR